MFTSRLTMLHLLCESTDYFNLSLFILNKYNSEINQQLIDNKLIIIR